MPFIAWSASIKADEHGYLAVFAVMGGLLSQVEAGGANANQFGAGAAALAFVYMG